jgi:hypothetical protein
VLFIFFCNDCTVTNVVYIYVLCIFAYLLHMRGNLLGMVIGRKKWAALHCSGARINIHLVV